MRVIQVVNVRWFNATAWYGVELARLFKAHEHDSLVVGLLGSEPLHKAKELGLATIGLDLNVKNPLSFPSLIKNMVQLINEFKPEIVNCHRGESFVLWAALKSYFNYGLVRTRGDQRLPRANFVNKYLHINCADEVVATNCHMIRYFAEKMQVSAKHLHTIYGGVDTDLFRFDQEKRQDIRQKLGYTDKDFVFGLLGRFDLVKGQKQCIEAVANLIKQALPVKLLLLGFTTATTQDEVQGWINNAGMQDHIQISGKVADVPAYLSALDGGVISSLYSETIARAALEIMACNRPLVSTSVGVMPDLLQADALCPPDNVLALSALLKRLVLDVEWCKEIKQNQAIEMKKLSSQSFYEQTFQVYKQILQGKTR